MDIRTMQYFLAVAREGSITKAAETLHMTQPPLSRQMMELEAELGVTLLDRSSKRVALTEDGRIFRKRAQEVVDLVESVRCDMTAGSGAIVGEVRIACGETDAVTLIAEVAAGLQEQYPSIKYRLLSGDRDFVTTNLQQGTADLGLLVADSIDAEEYGFLELPAKDTWGILTRVGSPLSRKISVSKDDLSGLPLILPYRAALSSELMSWFGENRDALNIVATYDLAYNASRFAKAGFGHVVALDGIVDVGKSAGLAFVPLQPELATKLFVVWQKHMRTSKAAQLLIEELEELQRHQR